MKIMDKDEDLLKKHFLDLADAASRKSIVTFSDFMNLNELNIFHSITQGFSFISWKTFGGYEAAERQIAAFIPDALYYDWEFPLSCLKISPLNAKFSDNLTHRDYLGAILNLGIDRGKLGDILVADSCAYVFCRDTMLEFISNELTRIRHTSVICKEEPLRDFSVPLKTELIRGTVASVRLDSILALAFKSSRSSIVGLIEGGKVFVNGKLVVSNGYSLKDEDIISARGLGKFRYTGITSQTKKGRCFVEIEKYI